MCSYMHYYYWVDEKHGCQVNRKLYALRESVGSLHETVAVNLNFVRIPFMPFYILTRFRTLTHPTHCS